MKFIEKNAIFDWFNVIVFTVIFVVLLLTTACGKDPQPGYVCPQGVTCCHDTQGNAVLCTVIHPY